MARYSCSRLPEMGHPEQEKKICRSIPDKSFLTIYLFVLVSESGEGL